MAFTSIRSRALIAACLMLLSCGAMAAQAVQPSPWVLNFETKVDAKGAKLETAVNPNVTADLVSLSLNRVTMPPCGVRAMHIHANVDELYYAISRPIAVALSDAAGNITRAVLQPGQALAIPRNLPHTIYNPDCKYTAVFFSFFNAFSGANVNIAKAAFDLNAGPFRAYGAPDKVTSTENAVNTPFAYDPQCLARCNLGPKFGQEPALAPKA